MKVTLETKNKRQVLDITDKVEKLLKEQEKADGVVNVFIKHTTAAISTADLDPGTDLDLIDTLDSIMPRLNFRHEHKPEHAPDHILGTLVGPEVTLPFEDKSLILGTWQRIILIEFDGPREREVVVTVL